MDSTMVSTALTPGIDPTIGAIIQLVKDLGTIGILVYGIHSLTIIAKPVIVMGGLVLLARTILARIFSSEKTQAD